MASGYGLKGGPGRCYQFWLDFQGCVKECNHPNECIHAKEVGGSSPFQHSPQPSPGGRGVGLRLWGAPGHTRFQARCDPDPPPKVRSLALGAAAEPCRSLRGL